MTALNEDSIRQDADQCNAKELVRGITQDPNPIIQDLVKRAKAGKELTPHHDENFLEKSKRLFCCDPQELHGTTIVSPELKKHARITADINTAANGIDFLSNASLYINGLKNLVTPLNFIFGIMLNVFVLWLSNNAVTATANRKPMTKIWSQRALFSAILLATLKSLVSGVGTELSINEEGIKSQLANTLINTQINRVKKLKDIESPQSLNANKQCQINQELLATLSKDSPRYQSLYVETHGEWGDRERDWSKAPKASLPVCPEAKLLEEKAFSAYTTAKNTLQTALVKRSQIGSDIEFLKTEMPSVYTLGFKENGAIASGQDAIMIAIKSFTHKLSNGDISGLGFSLFFMALSIITSILSITMSVSYSNREDVLLSRDQQRALWRDIWLDQIRHNQLQENQANKPTED